MTHQENLFYYIATFHYFMMLVWPWIFLDSESSWGWISRKRSSHYHNNLVLFLPSKPPDIVKDLYDGQTYDPKTRVDIWTSMEVVPLEYGNFDQNFHVTMYSLGLLMGLPSNGIIWFVRLLLCWCGLVLGPTWWFIDCSQTHSAGIVEVLDINGDHSWWAGFYCKTMTSWYITEIKAMIPQMWVFRNP